MKTLKTFTEGRTYLLLLKKEISSYKLIFPLGMEIKNDNETGKYIGPIMGQRVEINGGEDAIEIAQVLDSQIKALRTLDGPWADRWLSPKLINDSWTANTITQLVMNGDIKLK